MTEATRPTPPGGAPGSGESPFEAVDPKLTVFALANGMDLAKSETWRRLEWFSDGLERGIIVESDAGATFKLRVVSWRTRSEDVIAEATVREAVPAGELTGAIATAVESANAL